MLLLTLLMSSKIRSTAILSSRGCENLTRGSYHPNIISPLGPFSSKLYIIHMYLNRSNSYFRPIKSCSFSALPDSIMNQIVSPVITFPTKLESFPLSGSVRIKLLRGQDSQQPEHLQVGFLGSGVTNLRGPISLAVNTELKGQQC